MNPIETPGETVTSPPPTGVTLTSTQFADRVMGALATAPAPTPTRSFLAALRGRAPGNAARSLSVASHLVTVRSWPVAPSVRARSFGLVLGVAFVLATGSLAAAAAVHEVVPLRLGGPGVIDAGGAGAEPPPTVRRPAAPPPVRGAEASAAPVMIDVQRAGHDASKPAEPAAATGGDQTDHRGDGQFETGDAAHGGSDGARQGGSTGNDPGHDASDGAVDHPDPTPDHTGGGGEPPDSGGGSDTSGGGSGGSDSGDGGG